MLTLWEITNKDIEQLDEIQLVSILSDLLYLEATRYNIPSSTITCAQNINAADDGEDASIKWISPPEKTDWLPHNNILFQCKATKLQPAKCATEILVNSESEVKLKPAVKKLFDDNGLYILFTNESCTKKMINGRIEGFRKGIQMTKESYFETAQIQIYDANKIAKWVNQYICSTVKIMEYLKRPIPSGFKTWSQWCKAPEFKMKFETDSKLNETIANLRSYLSKSQKVARITGLSGLGKSRLALETFRECPSSIVYYDASKNVEGILSVITSWVAREISGIVIIDDCPLELHRQCMSEIQNVDSKLSLLTMDYSFEECSGDYVKIRMPRSSDEVIKKLIDQSFPRLSKFDIDRIVNFAQGFPQMAVLIAHAKLENKESIGNLTDDILVKKLLWGRGKEDTEQLKVISACAIFEHLGFSDSVIEQRNFVADKLCSMSEKTFYEKVIRFLKRGIVDVRGRYIQVTPQPLAIRLAADWWEKCPAEFAIELFTGNLPKGLLESLSSQLSKLHFIPNAQEVVRKLCTETAPFGQAEVIMSEKGSHLFRALVEVNPIAATQALKKIITNFSTEELKNFRDGRRNIVWSLERLCFWEATFYDAAIILLNLAVAENETWSNNSTGTLTQLFHIQLSGTKVDLKSRLRIIEYALSKQDPQFDAIAIKMLDHALIADYFSGISAIGLQGTRTDQDEWKPTCWQDIFDYWEAVLFLLVNVAEKNKNYAVKVSNVISSRIHALLRYDIFSVVSVSVVKVNTQIDWYWPEIITKLKRSIGYYAGKIPETRIDEFRNLLSKLIPQKFKDKMALIVSVPSWDYLEEDNNQKVEEFVDECLSDLETFYLNLPSLFSGEQRKGALFAQKLSKGIVDKKKFIDFSLNAVRSIENANTIVLSSFLFEIKEINPELVKNTIEEIFYDPMLAKYYIDIVAILVLSACDFEKIISLTSEKKMPISKIRQLAYGRALSDTSAEDVIAFCEKLLTLGTEAKIISLEIICLYCHRDEIRFLKFIPLVMEIVSTQAVLCNLGAYSSRDEYNWQFLVSKILDSDHSTNDFVKKIAHNIIFCFETDIVLKIDRQLDHVVRILLKKYYVQIWPNFSEVLLDENTKRNFRLRSLFRGDFSIDSTSKYLFQEVPEEYICAWCDQYPERAPQIACELLPAVILEGDILVINPFVMKIAEKYINNDYLLKNIEFNIFPSSWSDSLVPSLEKRICALKNYQNYGNPKIILWVSEVIQRLQEDIIQEKTRDAEREIGIY